MKIILKNHSGTACVIQERLSDGSDSYCVRIANVDGTAPSDSAILACRDYDSAEKIINVIEESIA